jgi:hypothetical protein
LVVDDGIRQVELVLGAGDGDVEEAAFFFEGGVAAFVDGAFVGEHAVGEPDGEDDLPFEAFGLSKSHTLPFSKSPKPGRERSRARVPTAAIPSVSSVFHFLGRA